MKRGSGTRARARRHARRARRAVEGRRCRRTYIFASLVCCGLGRELGKGEVRARRELFTHRAKRSETRDRPISARFLTYRPAPTEPKTSHVSRKRNFHEKAKTVVHFYKLRRRARDDILLNHALKTISSSIFHRMDSYGPTYRFSSLKKGEFGSNAAFMASPPALLLIRWNTSMPVLALVL